MTKRSEETRRRIIEAADILFYGEGLKSVGVDAIAAKAGVTKRTLYYHFPSKDNLIAAYLDARDHPTRDRYQNWIEQYPGTLPGRVQGMFLKLAEHAKNPRWRGCGFARAAAELAGMPGHPGVSAASKHKQAFEAWLDGLLRADGVQDHTVIAKQLMVLLDGAITQILIHHDARYAEAAGMAAKILIETADRRGTSAPVKLKEQQAMSLS